jgi:uncharacterized membrane protein YhaH (DUF805 family)
MLDPRGRCSNRDYVRWSAACLAFAAPFVCILALDDIVLWARLACLAVVWLLIGAMWIAAIRRVHDEDRRHYEACWHMGGPTLLVLIWMTLPAFDVFPPRWLLMSSAMAGGFVSYVGFYAIMQGQDGTAPNRYGPPTIRRPTAQDRRRFRGMKQV